MKKLGGSNRPNGGTLSRFAGHSAHADRKGAALRENNPAVIDGHSIFQKSVVDASLSPRLLVSGVNSPKTGGRILKGAWAGMPVFTLTLEERATCPRSCHLWRECYGNAMPLARRHRDDGMLIDRLEFELSQKQQSLTRYAVRLHILGDFFSVEYARLWSRALDQFDGLHVWGYTAHPKTSAIGTLLRWMNGRYPDRCAIRFSTPPNPSAAYIDDAMTVTTIWRQPEGDKVPEGQICPVSTNKTQACGTCGLCWSPAMQQTPIVFVGHGKKPRKKENRL